MDDSYTLQIIESANELYTDAKLPFVHGCEFN